MGTADKPKTDLKASIASIGSTPDKSQTGKVPDAKIDFGDFRVNRLAYWLGAIFRTVL